LEVPLPGNRVDRSVWNGSTLTFGMAVDPYSGDLWETENGDDAFSELNRVEAGIAQPEEG